MVSGENSEHPLDAWGDSELRRQTLLGQVAVAGRETAAKRAM